MDKFYQARGFCLGRFPQLLDASPE